MNALILKRVAIALTLCHCATSIAFAQYVWLNERGVKQYSDMPPPASVPNSRVLKMPKRAPLLAPANDQASEPQPTEQQLTQEQGGPSVQTDALVESEPVKTVPQSLADRNADFQRRRAEQAEKERQMEEQTRQAAEEKKNCDSARSYKRSLEEGDRLSRINESGERVRLNDEQRISEQREVNRILGECN